MHKYHVGYTTGVFDLFHIGHLNILKNAKEQCEYLIVGISTDELVKEYKSELPIIPFEQRCEIVKAIKYVDEVISQDTMDKLNILGKFKFDVMFHGDDWKDSKLYKNYEIEFQKYGIDIVYLPHTKGISSSKIKKKMYK